MKGIFIFSNPLIFQRVTAIQVSKNTDFLEKKLSLSLKNNHFGKKSLTGTQSLFKRAMSLYLFFLFRTLKFDVSRHRLDHASTRFRAYDR